jgi:hypothetical protein
MKSVVSVTSIVHKVAKLGWRTLALGVVMGALVFVQSGCKASQPGLTAAEANRRHKRILRTSTEQMLADIDTVLLMDRPSHLTDRRLP